MISIPIHIARHPYRGRNPAKMDKAARFNQAAAVLERHINEEIEELPNGVHVILYGTIAHETGYPIEVVREVCFSIDAGHSGFTVNKGNVSL